MPKVTPKDAENEAGPVIARPTLARHIAFWGLAGLGLVLFLYVFSSILLPFLAGMVLAYFLDPVADRLEKMGLSRIAATVVILIGFIVAVLLGLMIVLPVLGTQLADFASRLPEYLTRLQELANRLEPAWVDNFINGETDAVRENLSSILAQGTGFLGTLFKSVWSSGVAIVNVASLFIVTPVVAFYMLLDWDHMVEKVDSWVPRDHVETVRQIARDINVATAGFVRGQGTLCLILGIFYAVGLSLVGLNFGLLIGLFAGLISFIPYVGSLLGFGLSIGIALVQFWPEWWWVLAVAAVFFSGQFLEGNILQPKLVGKSVGLHPVWLMFALFAFGYLFGFAGLLIAVPAAAAVAVLVRFAINQYLASPLYSGHAQTPAKTPKSRG
ncbi:AI-2E family transporter [Nitratireductor rhodophyticola]|uniref:AI-2E family transporter n=1 Tax=Nitratireductor rhodophyticola TaxID=2854036 RepID=UPI002AC8B2A5|nr:AI-2E family transporter [Nitratireductor rhodophyticola]WPZ13987.1 AI-2E family transporter [Nitratireductor rhodophyticola]